MLSRAALSGIWFYQRFLSRRKGWRCAHSVLHGGTGCSGFVKFAIRDYGVIAAIPAIRQRFRDCREAAEALNRRLCVAASSTAEEDDKGGKRKESRSERLCDGCESGVLGCQGAGDCLSMPLCRAGSVAKSVDGPCSGTDCTPGCDFCGCGG